MATTYAIAVRHRCLLLPWDYKWRKDNMSHPHSECVASAVAWSLLSSIGHWPGNEDSYDNPTYSLYATVRGTGLCWNCKNLSRQLGLHVACSSCTVPSSYQYMRAYFGALRFASNKWQQSKTPSLDWTTSFLAEPVQAAAARAVTGADQQLSRSAKLKLLAQTRQIKLIES